MPDARRTGTSLAQDAAVLHVRTPALIVDTTSIVTLCRDGASLDTGLLKEMLDLFEAEVAARVHDLVEALASSDRKAIRDAAHSVKGSAAAIGAMTLRHLAGDLEHESKFLAFGPLGTSIAALHQEFTDVSSAIRTLHPELFR
jgi:HPt (histidine-containing phosphotransfer) domain-containing protein